MSFKDTFFYTIKPEELKATWEKFAKEINGVFRFQDPIRANIGGPIYVYEISSTLDQYNLKIDQTVYIHPGSNDQPTLLHYCLTKKVNQKIYFRIWKRSLFDKILGLNKMNSGIAEIDNNFSLKTNSLNLRELITKDKNIRESVTSSTYLLNVETKNHNIEINLKRSGITNSVQEFRDGIVILRKIIKEIA